jgi:hypothetical protein
LRNYLYDQAIQTCDLQGFATWGEYMEHYMSEPRCTRSTQPRVLLNTNEMHLRGIDQKFVDHSLLDGYWPGLSGVLPSSHASLRTVYCKEATVSVPPPPPKCCEWANGKCTMLPRSDGTCL